MTVVAFRRPAVAKNKRNEPIAPTPEQIARGRFDLEDTHDKLPGGRQITIGKAFRRKPMVETLYQQSLFSEAEFKALMHYRHHADLANRSPLKDSLRNLVRVDSSRGSGEASREVLNAIRVRDDCERAAGALADILRAVVLDDVSLSEWVKDKHGAIETCRETKAGTVCRLEPRRKQLEIAKLEICVAAQRVMAELDA